MFIAQLCGMACACWIAPLCFWLYWKGFDLGVPDSNYPAPFAVLCALTLWAQSNLAPGALPGPWLTTLPACLPALAIQPHLWLPQPGRLTRCAVLDAANDADALPQTAPWLSLPSTAPVPCPSTAWLLVPPSLPSPLLSALQNALLGTCRHACERLSPARADLAPVQLAASLAWPS